MLGEITKVVSFKMMDYAHQYSCISGLCLMDFWGEKIHIKIFNLSFVFFFKNYKVGRQIACWYLKTRGNSATVFGIVYKKGRAKIPSQLKCAFVLLQRGQIPLWHVFANK